MPTQFDTTITDKKTYVSKIIDTVKYSTLSDQDKVIFETLRNSLLEIMPLAENSNQHDDEALRFAENYAFINLKVFTTNITQIIDAKISALEELINIKLNALSTPSPTGP